MYLVHSQKVQGIEKQGETPLSRDKAINKTQLRDNSGVRTIDKNFKIIKINMLKDQQEKVDNLHKGMGNFKGDVETIQKRQR